MSNNSILQIGLIIIAVVVAIVYIKPTVASIGSVQDELFVYEDAVSKATEFNELLSGLLATERSFSAEDMEALDRFLPTSIDQAQIMRDLETIIKDFDVTLLSISAGEVQNSRTENVDEDGNSIVESRLSSQDFILTIDGTYDVFKNLLAKLERNSYPLEVTEISFSGQEGNTPDPTKPVDEFSFTVTLQTYALSATIN